MKKIKVGLIVAAIINTVVAILDGRMAAFIGM